MKRERIGCCCAEFVEYDPATGETVDRSARRHCCPEHGEGRHERQTQAR